jgi:hypothetical protein
MSLAPDFIPSIPTKAKGHIYSLSEPGYLSPRLQITSIHENPIVSRLKAQPELPNVPVIGTHGVKWMTVSDGKHCTSAILDLELNHLVDNGQLKENSIIDIDAYAVDDNIYEAANGRTKLLCIGLLTVFLANFPCRLGNPKDVFDFPPKSTDGKGRAGISHPLLLLSPRAISSIETGTSGNVYTAMKTINLQVTSLEKYNDDIWDLQVFDGEKSFDAAMKRTLELDKLGVHGQLENNVATIMTDSAQGLKVNDIISVPQYIIMAAGEKKKMVLYNCTIVHHAAS